MRNLLLVSTLFLSILSFGQTQFDFIGGLPVSANTTGCFYIDLNTFGENTGVNDVKFVHGNGEIYFDAVAGDSLRLPAKFQYVFNGMKFEWADCDVSANLFNKNRVYLMHGQNSIPLGTHVLPFKYNNLYNYIVLNVEDGAIKIMGWVFNIPHEEFDCYNIAINNQIEQKK